MRNKAVFVLILLLAAAVAADAAVVKVKTAVADVRSKPDRAAPVIARVSQGSMFEVASQTGAWFEVSVSDRTGKLLSGYISADAVEVIGGASAPAGGAAGPRAFGGLRFEFSLGGGLANINGDDYNAWVRDMNAYYADLNDVYSSATAYSDKFSADWPEIKWLPGLKGDLVLRLGSSFGVGLGFQYLTKSNSGLLNEVFKDQNYRVNNSSTTYYLQTATWDYTSDLKDSLRVIPITLSAYGFLPVGRAGEAYGFAGIGYFMGKLKLDETYTETYDDVDVYFNNDGTQFNTRKNQGQYVETYVQDLSSNAIGFHLGAGFSYSVTPMIQVFGEALYRIATLKDWSGAVTDDWTDEYYYGFDSTGYNNYSESGTDSFTGTLYKYTYSSDTTGKSYTRLGSFEGTPEETENRSNFSKAEVKLNGPEFRIGVRFSFGRR